MLTDIDNSLKQISSLILLLFYSIWARTDVRFLLFRSIPCKINAECIPLSRLCMYVRCFFADVSWSLNKQTMIIKKKISFTTQEGCGVSDVLQELLYAVLTRQTWVGPRSPHLETIAGGPPSHPTQHHNHNQTHKDLYIPHTCLGAEKEEKRRVNKGLSHVLTYARYASYSS